MGDMRMARLQEGLAIRNRELGSALVIQNIDQGAIRVDKFDIHCQKMFLKYSPLMFFVVSSPENSSSNVRLDLVTYNEEVFEMFHFQEDTSSQELYDFIVDKFRNVSYSNCSGIKKENIKDDKLERYITDTDTLFERFGDSFIFRSITCKRIIENESSMDLCDDCKTWLLFKETSPEELAEVKFKVEVSGDEDDLDAEQDIDDGGREDDMDYDVSYEPPGVGGGVGRGGKKRSQAWQHFTDLERDNSAQCNYCQKVISTGPTKCTTGLLKHIRNHHQEVWTERQQKRPAPKQGNLPKRQKRNKVRSLVWNHFTMSTTMMDHSECIICRNAVGCSNGNTSGMWAHMKRKHPKVDLNSTGGLETKTENEANAEEVYENDPDDNFDLNENDKDDPNFNNEGIKTEDSLANGEVHEVDPTSKFRGRSLVWNFFTRTQPTSAQCSLCNTEICTVGNNTSGMIKHLVSMHEELKFREMLEKQKEVKQIRKEEERLRETAPSRLTSYPKSSPAWKYFTVSPTARDLSVCNLCGAEISCVKKNTSGMLKHLIRWHPDTDIVMNKREECKQCGRKFFFKKTLIKHMKVDHGTEYRKFKCPEEGCEVYFRLFKGKLMRRHLSEAHGHNFNVIEGMYSCDQCDKKFKTFDVLAKHIKGVHESIHVPCYICAKLVKEGTPMEHHIKYVHLQPNKFSCEEPGCDFTTRHKDTLLDHQTKHTGTKRWCCGTCGKEHRLRSGLYLCEKTHEGYDAWQHVCSQCSKRFISKQKLVMHMRMHTGEKPFWCPVCRFRSARMSNLNAHIKKSHGMSWKEAEIRYGISAKTGQVISREKTEEFSVPLPVQPPSLFMKQ